MKTFRAFLAEAKQNASLIEFKDSPPAESRLETEFRIGSHNTAKNVSIHHTEFEPLPDEELPHQEVHINGKRRAAGWVLHGVEVPYHSSSAKNLSPTNKKFKITGTHRVVSSERSPYSTGSGLSHNYFTELETPAGNKFVHQHMGSYGVFHLANDPSKHGTGISSTDFHNHLREVEPSFFPAVKANENFFSTEHQQGEYHHVFVGKTEPFGAAKMKDWSHLHPMTRTALEIAHKVVNRAAEKYGHKPYKVKAFYSGSHGRNAVHLSNGKDEAVLLHVRGGTGSTKTLYNKFGSSSVTEDGMGSPVKVFGQK